MNLNFPDELKQIINIEITQEYCLYGSIYESINMIGWIVKINVAKIL